MAWLWLKTIGSGAGAWGSISSDVPLDVSLDVVCSFSFGRSSGHMVDWLVDWSNDWPNAGSNGWPNGLVYWGRSRFGLRCRGGGRGGPCIRRSGDPSYLADNGLQIVIADRGVAFHQGRLGSLPAACVDLPAVFRLLRGHPSSPPAPFVRLVTSWRSKMSRTSLARDR